jgi:predicted phosphodiesterase
LRFVQLFVLSAKNFKKPMSLHFCVISDVHLEFYDNFAHPEHLYENHKCDTLIIAGDLGQPLGSDAKPDERYIYHLKRLRQIYKYIVYVPGNHEYYRCLDICKTTQEVDTIMRNICESLDIHFLQKSCWEHPETHVLFAGCTLWSQIDYVGKSKCNDFMRVFDSVYKYLELHANHKAWLTNVLQEHNEEKVIVVTHHLPTLKMVSKRYVNENNTGYASDLDDLFCKPVMAWVMGHSHDPKVETINGILMILNPTGYPGEKFNIGRRQDSPFVVKLE